jgi:hypothetical protein
VICNQQLFIEETSCLLVCK